MRYYRLGTPMQFTLYRSLHQAFEAAVKSGDVLTAREEGCDVPWTDRELERVLAMAKKLNSRIRKSRQLKLAMVEPEQAVRVLKGQLN